MDNKMLVTGLAVYLVLVAMGTVLIYQGISGSHSILSWLELLAGVVLMVTLTALTARGFIKGNKNDNKEQRRT